MITAAIIGIRLFLRINGDSGDVYSLLLVRGAMVHTICPYRPLNQQFSWELVLGYATHEPVLFCMNLHSRTMI